MKIITSLKKFTTCFGQKAKQISKKKYTTASPDYGFVGRNM